jgi:hypothetical protein
MMELIYAGNKVEDIIAILGQVDKKLNMVEVDGSVRARVVGIVE